jgi:hypothetical protein
VEAQDLRRAAGSVNDPARLLQSNQNVVSHAGFQAFQGYSRSSASRGLPRAFGECCRCRGEHFRIDLERRAIRQDDRPFQDVF